MDDTLLSALLITAIGMSLLFLVLAFFYGLLWLLTAVAQGRPAANLQARSPAPGPEPEKEATLEAAAIAVALARARAIRRAGPPVSPADITTADPWWSLHHQRQLTLNPGTRRR